MICWNKTENDDLKDATDCVASDLQWAVQS